jgi:hypothetical protein
VGQPPKYFGAANANYKGLVERLAESVIGQSEFQDWVVAEQVNDKLHLLDRRAGQLQTLFLSGALTAGQVSPVSTALLHAFFKVDDVMTPSANRATDKGNRNHAWKLENAER